MITASITASFSSSDRSALALELARDAFLAHDFKRSDDETAVLLVCVKAHLDIPLGAKSGGYSDSFMPPIKLSLALNRLLKYLPRSQPHEVVIR
jgi:hypothetical protein